MIDKDGYRSNVGIVICNHRGQLLWARRIRQNSWQFPQGGIDPGEHPQDAMYRELYEELGLRRDEVKLLRTSKTWLRYKLPKRLVRWDEKPLCIGQKQKWFLLMILKDRQKHIEFDRRGHPEFDGWRWVTFWYPVRQVVSFKQDVYRRVLAEFAPVVLALNGSSPAYGERKKTNSKRGG